MIEVIGLVLFAILCLLNPYLWFIPLTMAAVWASNEGGWTLGAFCTIAVLIYAGVVLRARRPGG